MTDILMDNAEHPDAPTICWRAWNEEGGRHRCAKLAPHEPPHRCCCGAPDDGDDEE